MLINESSQSEEKYNRGRRRSISSESLKERRLLPKKIVKANNKTIVEESDSDQSNSICNVYDEACKKL